MRFDFDVLTLTKILNGDVEKMDTLSLNAILAFYKMDLKEGITY